MTKQRTTYRVEHRARVSRIIETTNGRSQIVREFFAPPSSSRSGEQRAEAVEYVERMRKA